jgi:hypothetical protein
MSYENFVMRSARNQRAPRTQSEAFRDADYGTAIWRCETTNQKGVDALTYTATVLLLGFIVGLLISPLLG